MDNKLNQILSKLVRGRAIAALATLDQGEPFVSMVPYVLFGTGPDFLIHVSLLSAHTRHMLQHPRVSLMVSAAENTIDENGTAIQPQALPRVTLQGDAIRLDASGVDYAKGKALYLERFAPAAQMFELPDFSLFKISPRSLRFIAGFGSAHNLSLEAWARIASDPS